MRSDAFFRQATQRLFSTLELEAACQRCLLFIREHVPSDYLSIHLFDLELGLVETVADATAASSPPVSRKTTLTPEVREMLKAALAGSPPDGRALFIPNLGSYPLSRQLGLDLGTPEASCLALDLCVEGRYIGLAALTNSRGEPFTEAQADLFSSLHDPLAVSAASFLRYREMVRLKDALADKARFFQNALLRGVEEDIAGADYGLKDVLALARRVAASDAPALLLGETGVGKEVIAGAIHRLSPRRDGPFITVNCGAIPPGLLESELFGHEKGAFTGAARERKGYFERADGGTIFLDEIGELSPEAQTRFLRALAEKTIERLGGGVPIRTNIRVIAATHRDLTALCESGAFRRDLFFRLNVFPVRIPPLRERKMDIPVLVFHFIRKKARDMGLAELPRTAPGALDRLSAYDWPGNVRELENIVEREIILSRDGTLHFAHVSPGPAGLEGTAASAAMPLPPSGAAPPENMNLDAAMVRHIEKALRMASGRVEGPLGAAAILGVNPRTLQSRMKKLGVPFGRSARARYAG